jgi:hypothetical protein
MADYNLGCTVRLDDEQTLVLLAELYEEGAIRHIQVQAVPLPQPLFRKHLARVAAAGIPAAVHAPHHGHGVNPCAPAAYDDRPANEIEVYIEEAMSQTLEAADVLDRHNDPRLTLENLPAVYAGYPLLGNTAGELAALAGNKITRFCLDFPHLACTANYRHLSFVDELERFESLDVALHHLSNIRQGSITDEHLALDHPDSGLNLSAVFARLRRHPDVPTTLEYKQDSADVYARQVKVFAGLWDRAGE